MRLWAKIVFLAVLTCGSAHAEKPSEASVRELLVLANSKNLLKTVEAQMDGMMQNMMKTAMKDQAVTEEKQKLIDQFRDKVLAIYKQEMSWEKMEPLFIEIYSNSLSQEDVDGINAFYRSPAGKSFVSKMPTMMQQSFVATQKMMTPLMEKVLAAGKELDEEIHNLDKK